MGNLGVIAYSSEGEYWFELTSGVTANLRGITWSGTQWAVVGDAGTILTSPDAITWTAQTSSVTTPLLGVAWSPDVQTFVAVGLAGVVLTSPDGVTWTVQNSQTVNNLRAVAWVVGVWDVGGWDSSTLYWEWSYFTAVGDLGTVITSVDGITWTVQSPGVTEGLNAVSSDGFSVISVGNAGTFISSVDSVNWTQGNSTITNTLFSTVNGQRVAVLVGDSGVILRSTGDYTLAISDVSQVVTDLYGVTYSEYLNLFVAVGESGMIMTSSIENPTQIFTAISDSGYISASYDGNVWTIGSRRRQQWLQYFIHGRWGPEVCKHRSQSQPMGRSWTNFRQLQCRGWTIR